ncbi:P27 family phage terminase small subunit [Fusobacterium varium]|uniref:P27 family phage terminase small subunit n=1 Tax=Fusobacterium varium TaxID=856 RepID=UPI00356B0E29
MGAKKPLSTQKGHLTTEQQKQKELEEAKLKFIGKEHLKKNPEWLINDYAVNEWKRLVKELQESPTFNNLDYNNLGAYCNALAKYTAITKEVGLKFRIGKEINNLTTLELKYSDEVKKYASLLGLTAEGKLKLMFGDTQVDKNNVKNEFGDI